MTWARTGERVRWHFITHKYARTVATLCGRVLKVTLKTEQQDEPVADERCEKCTELLGG